MEKQMVLASRNRGKIREMRAILAVVVPGMEILSLDDIGITDDAAEDGTTFAENAWIKAKAIADKGYIGIADDSGLCVDALGGEPGVYSARYAGGHGDDAANLALLLHRMENVSDRRAEFCCAIACVFPDGSEPILTVGEVRGEILRERRGEDGFGYDPVFYYPPFGKTFGELSSEEKNKISHRAVALERFAKALKERWNEE